MTVDWSSNITASCPSLLSIGHPISQQSSHHGLGENSMSDQDVANSSISNQMTRHTQCRCPCLYKIRMPPHDVDWKSYVRSGCHSMSPCAGSNIKSDHPTRWLVRKYLQSMMFQQNFRWNSNIQSGCPNIILAETVTSNHNVCLLLIITIFRVGNTKRRANHLHMYSHGQALAICCGR